MPTLATASEIVARLRGAGFEAYLAGGSVRDMLLGRAPGGLRHRDRRDAPEVTALFSETVQVGAAFGVVQVLADGAPYEVATFRTEGPVPDRRHPSSVRYATVREDALRRDFTINGLFWDPETRAVLDFVGGQADLAARVRAHDRRPVARGSRRTGCGCCGRCARPRSWAS